MGNTILEHLLGDLEKTNKLVKVLTAFKLKLRETNYFPGFEIVKDYKNE